MKFKKFMDTMQDFELPTKLPKISDKEILDWKKSHDERKDKHKKRCEYCNRSEDEAALILAPNPYSAEMYNSEEEVLMCSDCRDRARGDI